jgi:digeranylgeranylglycerophospholipid reductase
MPERIADVCDVIVVGAGPAGSVAARVAAEAGLSTLLVEKRQEIGAPVRCAEAVGAEATRPYLPQDERWINAHIAWYDVVNPAGDRVRLPPTEPTWIVDRKVFDVALAETAVRAGARVLTSTAAVGLLHDGERVAGVRLRAFGKLHEVRARLVIAADGTESQVARWAGLKTVPPMADYYSGAQVLLSGIGGRIDPTVCEYHLGSSLAPGGYVWVFPKGADRANVGLVVSADRAAAARPMALLDRFVEAHFPGASILHVVVGGIPATGALRRMVTHGLMAVGDAAHQADPLTAGGINLGMFGAEMALQVGIEALARGDVSAQALSAYERRWADRFGRQHAALYQVRRIVAGMEDARLAELIHTASRLPVAEMTSAQLLTSLLRQHPRLLLEARTLLTTGVLLK